MRLESFRVHHVLDQMLVAARIDTGDLVVDPQPTDLRTIVAVVIENLPPIGRSMNISVSGHAVAVCDAMRVRQIIRNLLINAAESDHGSVTIHLEQGQGDTALITLRHSGGVLGESERRYMFTPLFEPRPRQDGPVGAWLPLSVSRQLARLMGGDLTYQSSGDQSVFRLMLGTTTG